MTSVLRLLQLLGDRRRLLIIGVVAALAHVLLLLAPPLLVRGLLVELSAGRPPAVAAVVAVAGAIALVAVLRAACLYLDSFFHHAAAYGMLADLRVRLYDHLQRLSHASYNRRHTGALVGTVIGDVDTVELFVAHAISQYIVGICVPLGIAAVLLALSPPLGLLAVALVPPVALLLVVATPHLRRHWRAARATLADLNALIQDSLAGHAVIKAFGAEAERRRRVAEQSRAFERQVMRALAVGLWPTALTELAAGLALALVVAVGVLAVAGGSLPLADLFVVLVYLGLLYRPLIELAHANEGLQAALAAAERVFAILDEQPSVADVPGATAPSPPPTGWSVDFEAVTFAYEAGQPAVREVSFRIEPGQIVALVGPSGAGKTTLAALLQRLYDVDEGAIRLAGHDLRALPLAWLRAQIGVVMQEVFLFHGTVRDNLLIARPDADQAALEAAARAATAHDFIVALPEGYETVIGERGLRLSGGQRQRLSVARALLKDAPLLILDEATASVDAETESLIQAGLDRLLQRRTTLVIAHRLSTIRQADRIVVLDAGRVVEVGRHDKLLAADGLYARLYSHQRAGADWELRPATLTPGGGEGGA